MSSEQSIKIDSLWARNVAIGKRAHAGDVTRVPESRPPAADIDREAAVRMGFAVDVVGYSSRSVTAKTDAQRRVTEFIDEIARRLNVSIGPDSRQSTGDGMIAFLPSTVDASWGLATLLRTGVDWLAADNRRYHDRIRLRMAAVIGPVGSAPLGFSGDSVVECSRLLDSRPVRDALVNHPGAHLAVIISETLYAFAVRQRPMGIETGTFAPVRIKVKELRTNAWLWVEGVNRGSES